MEKFPWASKGMIGAAINGKLTELRLKAKRMDTETASAADAVWFCELYIAHKFGPSLY